MKLKNWPLVIGLLSAIHLPSIALGSPPEVHVTAFSKTYFTEKSALTISRKPSDIISLTNRSGSLRFTTGDPGIYQYDTVRNGRSYEFYFKVNSQTGQIIKVGMLSSPLRKYYSEKCKTQTSLAKVSEQIKKISEFVVNGEIEIESIFEKSCKEMLQKKVGQNLEAKIASQFVPSESYLLSCLQNEKAIEKISKIKSVAESLPGILDKYFLELKAVKDGAPSFKIRCEQTTDTKPVNGSYDAKTREIVFPAKDEMLNISECHDEVSIFSHEYLHHLGVKNESQLGIIEAICAEANSLEGLNNKDCDSTFTMKKCVDKPESCNQMGVPEAIRQAVSSDAKKERAEIVPKIQDQVKNMKLEDVKLEASSLAAATSVSQSSGYDSSIQAVAVAMQRNMKKVASVVDVAMGATVSTATAGSSKIDSRQNKKTSVRLPASEKKGSADVDEYVAEEIIADKFGIPVSQVREIAEKELKPQKAKSPAEIGAGSPQSSLTGAEGVTGFEAASSPAGNVPLQAGRRKERAIASTAGGAVSGFFSSQEILGSQYKELRELLGSKDFIQAIEAENVRIEAPREKKQFGSTKKDATVFVDTGRSFIRKKK